MLKKRLITSFLGIVLLVSAIWFDRPVPWFTVVVGAFSLLAALEFYRMTGVTKAPGLLYPGLIWTLLFIARPHFNSSLILPLLLTSALILSLVSLLFLPRKEGVFAQWAWTMGGILYAGWLFSHIVSLRLDAGKEWVILALFANFGSDTAAFLMGRRFGRHSLAPLISPAKTREGAISGLFGSILVALFITWSFGIPLSYYGAIAFGLLISVLGQLGDLVESLLKRNMGVKESGWLLPGHGGVLDRADSVIFAGVAAYYFWLFAVAG